MEISPGKRYHLQMSQQLCQCPCWTSSQRMPWEAGSGRCRLVGSFAAHATGREAHRAWAHEVVPSASFSNLTKHCSFGLWKSQWFHGWKEHGCLTMLNPGPRWISGNASAFQGYIWLYLVIVLLISILGSQLLEVSNTVLAFLRVSCWSSCSARWEIVLPSHLAYGERGTAQPRKWQPAAMGRTSSHEAPHWKLEATVEPIWIEQHQDLDWKPMTLTLLGNCKVQDQRASCAQVDLGATDCSTGLKCLRGYQWFILGLV